MRDSNLYFTNNGTISASTYSSILDISRWPAKGVWVELAITGGSGAATAPQLTATVQYSDSSTFATTPELGPTLCKEQGAITTAGFRAAKLCQSKRRYARIQYSVFGTSPCFTGVYAHVTTGPQRDDVGNVNTN